MAAALVPFSPAVVDRTFSNGLYPRLQQGLTGLSNLVPAALFDFLVCGVGAWWAIRTAADVMSIRRRGASPSFAAVFSRTVVTAAAAYLAFLLVWGLNYRRPPLTDRVAFEPTRVSRAAALSFAADTVSQLNALFARAHGEGWPAPNVVDQALSDAFSRTQRALGTPWQARPARPKTTIFDLYFRRAGVAGMTDPYFLETLVASDLLPFERPLVIAHEWSHLAGINDEGEANFVGWVTCMQASAHDRYSAWLFLFDELAGVLPAGDMRKAAATLGEGPRADLQAIRARMQRNVSPAMSQAGWRVYDGYLKANRIPEGAASYAGVIRLLTGTEFEPGWIPKLRK